MSMFTELEDQMKVAKAKITRAMKDGNDVDGGLREGISADTVKFRAEMIRNLMIKHHEVISDVRGYATIHGDGKMASAVTTNLFNMVRTLGAAGEMQFVDYLSRFFQQTAYLASTWRAIQCLPGEIHRDNQQHPAIRPAFKEIVKLMESADSLGTLKMECWNTSGGKAGDILGVEKLHECGNQACLAGHVRISPYFNRLLDFMPRQPNPVAITREGPVQTAELMAVLLHVPVWFATLMIFENSWQPGGKHPLYRVDWEEVTPKDILKILYRLRDGECAEGIYLSICASEK